MAKKKVGTRTPIPKGESKSDRFIRVVTPRINKAVKAIKVIGYCSGTTYEYTPKQVEQITKSLYAAINGVVDSFAAKVSKQDEFSFKEG